MSKAPEQQSSGLPPEMEEAMKRQGIPTTGDELVEKIKESILHQESLPPLERFRPAEFSRLSMLMQEHHAIFSTVWTMARPTFSYRIPTAAVLFNKSGSDVGFEINPFFWETLNDVQKCFVISHEASHVFLNHAIRADVKINDRANKAMDIVVNHSLVNSFGFDRQAIDEKNKYCWIDTVFKDANLGHIKENQSYEYYYALIQKLPESNGDGGGQLVDDHGGLQDAEEFIKRLAEELPEEAKKELKEFIEKHQPKNAPKGTAGAGSGGMFRLLPDAKVKKKRKWETVIKRWTQRFLNALQKDMSQWARISRRMSMIDSEMIIPSEMEITDIVHDKRKIQVWFFQDTSGSCSGYHERFFQAAESMPTDRFEIKMHCFDTEVYETTLESRKLYGFGGTSFDCIENYIQAHIRKHRLPYPVAVFVVTDGYGDSVNPEKPKNWHWFLTEPYTTYVPKQSKWYNLQDYE